MVPAALVVNVVAAAVVVNVVVVAVVVNVVVVILLRKKYPYIVLNCLSLVVVMVVVILLREKYPYVVLNCLFLKSFLANTAWEHVALNVRHRLTKILMSLPIYSFILYIYKKKKN